MSYSDGDFQAKEKEMERALKVSILSVGILAMIFALSIDSIFDLWVMCSDFVYVILFPQLVAVIYIPQSNSYGSFSGYCVGFFFRAMGGIKVFGFPTIIKYPYFDHATGEQLFPFRSFSMLLSLLSITIVSYLSKFLFEKKFLAPSCDVFYCYNPRPNMDISHGDHVGGAETRDPNKQRDSENTNAVGGNLLSASANQNSTASTYREPRSHRQLQSSIC